MNEKTLTLTPAQAQACYKTTGRVANGKPVFVVPTTKVLNLDSAFRHKLLCDGPTFTLGFACAFSCSFCYVENLLGRHSTLIRICRETGLNFDEFVVEKEDPLPVLRRQLVSAQGRPRHPDASDRRVVFASPLVDVAANLHAAQQTIAACRIILESTHWEIRLLSKSALLRKVAEGLVEHRERVIYGLSTGTFADGVARSFEHRASSITARLRTLHWLQDEGFRTFGMICPSLPQVDYQAFAEEAAAKIRAHRCEYTWAEVLNVRGKSLAKTSAGLRADGFNAEADRLEAVSKDREAWENYARATFIAHARVIPPEKLRFMQYVQPGQTSWWRERQELGAVLLGKGA